MAYSPEIYRQAQTVLEQRRSAAQARAATLRQQLLREVPRLREIEQQMALSSGKVVRQPYSVSGISVFSAA